MGQIRPVARVGPFLACFQPVLYSGPLTTRYACDRIKPLLSYSLLMTRYHAGPIPITPVYGPLTHGPLGPKGNRPNNVMWAVEYNTSPFHFWSIYGS